MNACLKSWWNAAYKTGFTAPLRKTKTVEMYSSARGTSSRLAKIAQTFAIPRGIQQNTKAMTTAKSVLVTLASMAFRRLPRLEAAAHVWATWALRLSSVNPDSVMSSLETARLWNEIAPDGLAVTVLKFDSVLSLPDPFFVNSILVAVSKTFFPCSLTSR